MSDEGRRAVKESVKMDFVIELIIECLIDLITTDGADVVNGSERTKGWSKGAKIALVVTSILLIIAVTAVLVICGVAYLLDGNREVGAVLLAAGIGFLIVTFAKFTSVYKKKRL